MIYNKLKQIVASNLKITNESINNINTKYLYEQGITRYNAIDIIQNIEKELNINIDYSLVNLHWFFSLDSLYKFTTESIQGTHYE